MYRRDCVSTKLLFVVSLLLASEVTSTADEKRIDEGLAERGYAVLRTYRPAWIIFLFGVPQVFHRLLSYLFLVSLIVLAPSQSALAQEGSSGDKIVRLLDERCASCHGKVNPQSGLNVLNHLQLTSKKLTDNASLAVVAGNLDQSELWRRITSKDEDSVMPPGEPLPADELALIETWIKDGAPAFPVVSDRRPFVSTTAVYQAIEHDLKQHSPVDARDMRYFSIQHLHNNPEVSAADLRTYRAALSKLINSLSWESTIVVPQPIDEHKTILRVNLANIGWDQNRLWRRLLQAYPYGLSYDSSSDTALAEAAAAVYAATDSRIPVVRADWFIATAAVPPLYHDLLRLPAGPTAARDLQVKLQVDVQGDFLKNRLERAGFVKSNVSNNNRLVDRYPAAYGAYWESFDFASSKGRQSLPDFPLGPEFADNPFARNAFQHDGGEIIFNLPNGLQAYLLVDKKGGRIDKGPIDVVFDSKQPLGNKEVINGISCIVCHNRGMQTFSDDIRLGTSVTGEAKQKVDRLFPADEKFAETVEQDSQRFLAALQLATKPFLNDDEDAVEREPVGAIARQYSDELFLIDIASELHHDNADVLKVLFNDASYRRLGMGVISNGGVMKRQTWENFGKGNPYSPFQLVSEQLQLGTPEKVF